MKRYDQNFKDEALKLSDDIGIKKACEQLNLNYGTLSENMITELQNVVQKIVTEVTDLQERYEFTLGELETNCNTLSKKVAGFLRELE